MTMKGRNSRAARTASDQNTDLITPVNPPDLTDALPLHTPRLLSRQQAAAYCGASPETFDDYRRRGIVPGPISGTNRWDRKHIDLWLDKASGIASKTNSSLDEWRAKRNG